MKTKHGLLFGFAVLGMAAIFMFAGCKTEDDPPAGPKVDTYTGTSGGTIYKLEITDGTAYKLTVGSKTSSGAAVKDGSDFELTPTGKTAFYVTVSGADITAMNGTITYSDNTTEPAPTTLTPPTDPGPGPGPGSESPVSSLSITTDPTKTVYKVGDTLDLTGMAVTAYHEDGTSTANFTGYTLSSDYQNNDPITAGPSGTALAESGSTDPRVYIYVWANGKYTSFAITVVKPITKESFNATWGALQTTGYVAYSKHETLVAISDSDETGATLALTMRDNGAARTDNYGNTTYSMGNSIYKVTLTATWGDALTGDAANQGFKITGELSAQSSGSSSNPNLYQDWSYSSIMQEEIPEDVVAVFGENGDTLASNLSLVINQTRSTGSGNPIVTELRLYYGEDEDYLLIGKAN